MEVIVFAILARTFGGAHLKRVGSFGGNDQICVHFAVQCTQVRGFWNTHHFSLKAFTIELEASNRG